MRHYERGSSMVETAIALSAVLLLTFGIIDFARALYDYHLVSDAARMGARFASVRGSTCVHTNSNSDPWPCSASVASYVEQQSPVLGTGALTVTPTYSNTTGCTSLQSPYNGPGCLVTVSVTYQFAFFLPLMPNGFTIASSSQMVIAQ